MSELSWLIRASDLLAGEDPGPTPFVVEDLLVAGGIAAIQGAAKTGKTWLVLELALSIVTGEPALGQFAVPSAGPVVVILEESGVEALWRRLDMLTRGRGIKKERLADLHVAANRGVRLNDEEWQRRLEETAELRPAAVFLDPLVRMKGATVDENSQRELGPVLDYMRALRDATKATVAFVHHTGHEGGRLRGSSDLEGYWESKVTLKRGDHGNDLIAEHREAGATGQTNYKLLFDEATRTVGFVTSESTLRAAVVAYLETNPDASARAVADAVTGRRSRVLELVKEIRNGAVPAAGNHREPPPSAHVVAGGSPDLSLEGSGTTANGAVPDSPEPDPDEELARVRAKLADEAVR